MPFPRDIDLEVRVAFLRFISVRPRCDWYRKQPICVVVSSILWHHRRVLMSFIAVTTVRGGIMPVAHGSAFRADEQTQMATEAAQQVRLARRFRADRYRHMSQKQKRKHIHSIRPLYSRSHCFVTPITIRKTCHQQNQDQPSS